MSVLSINRLCFSYGSRELIHDLSLSLEAGERVCLTAPSGSGKTTLLRLIAGLERPGSGELAVSGRVSYLFQEDRLLPWLSAYENLLFIGAAPDAARDALGRVGLSEDADKLPRELSGGMKRRAAIARMLCTDCELLLLDEPFAGLDADNRRLAAEAIGWRFSDSAMILVTHLPEEAELLGARAIML